MGPLRETFEMDTGTLAFLRKIDFLRKLKYFVLCAIPLETHAL